jgi:Fe(3+) dicitrate transport protein
MLKFHKKRPEIMIDTVFTALLYPFINPSSRTFWLGLLITMVITSVYYLSKRPNSWSKKNALELMQSSSMKLDLQLYVGRQLLRVLMGSPIWFTAWLVATRGVRWMDTHIGAPNVPECSSLTITLTYTFSLFVLWDLSRFVLHWLMHKIPFLWEFHQVHHSAASLTPLTFHRIHPVESWLYEIRSVLVSGLIAGFFYWIFRDNINLFTILGVPGIAFLLNIITGNLRHSHVWLPYPRVVEQWLISPAQHQIHHSIDEQHYGSNYGTWLSIWDRIFGTLMISDQQPTEYGIEKSERNHQDNLVSAWFGPLLAIVPKSKTLTGGLALFLVFQIPFANSEESSSTDDEESNDENHEFDEEIIIYDDKEGIRVAGSAHKVDKEQLELFDLNDIEGVLRSVPGVVTRGEDGFGLRPNIGIRGANSDRSAKVTLMEDGILLAPAPYAAPAAYYFPMSTRLVGVEVFKGAASTRHGPQTVGGALNVLTRKIPDEKVFYGDVAVGIRDTYKVHTYLGGSGSNAGFLLEAVHLQTSGFKQLDSGGKTGFNHSELMWKGGVRSAKNKVELKLGYTNETSNETYLGITQEDWSETPYRRYASSELGLMQWNRTQAHLVWASQPKPNIQVRTVAYHHYLDRAWQKFNGFQDGTDTHQLLQVNPNTGQGAVYLAVLKGEENSTTEGQMLQIGTNVRQFHSFGVQTATRWQWFNDKLSSTLDVGLRLHGDNVTRVHTEESYNMISGTLQNVADSDLVLLDSFATARALAAYVYEDFQINKVHLFPSIRVEVVQGYREDKGSTPQDPVTRTTFLPGFGSLVDLTDWSDIFASVHRGFSPVSPGQPAEVQPEVSWNYEAGFRLDEGDIHSELIGFFNDYENITGQCTMSGGCTGNDIDRQYNGGAAWIYGIEAVFGKRFLFESGMELPIQASYTLTESSFQTDFTSNFPQFGQVRVGDSLPYTAKHQASLNVSLEIEEFNGGIGVSYRSGMLNEAGNFDEETDIPSLLLIDAATVIPVRNKLKLQVTGSNLLNNQNITSLRPYGARPVAPRQIMFGLKWEP